MAGEASPSPSEPPIFVFPSDSKEVTSIVNMKGRTSAPSFLRREGRLRGRADTGADTGAESETIEHYVSDSLVLVDGEIGPTTSTLPIRRGTRCSPV